MSETTDDDMIDVVRLYVEEDKRRANKATARPMKPLPYVDLALDPIPPREWLVPERIPMGNVTMLAAKAQSASRFS